MDILLLTPVCSVHVGRERVFPSRFPVPFINPFISRSCSLLAGAQEAALGHLLEDEAQLGARGDLLEEALLGVRDDADKVAGGGGREGGPEHLRPRERPHGGAQARGRTAAAASAPPLPAAENSV